MNSCIYLLKKKVVNFVDNFIFEHQRQFTIRQQLIPRKYVRQICLSSTFERPSCSVLIVQWVPFIMIRIHIDTIITMGNNRDWDNIGVKNTNPLKLLTSCAARYRTEGEEIRLHDRHYIGYFKFKNNPLVRVFCWIRVSRGLFLL